MWSMRSPLLVNFCIRLLRQSTTMISSRGVHVTPHEDRPSSELQSSTCHNAHTTPIQHPHNTHTTPTQHPHNTHTTPTQHPHNIHTTSTQHPHNTHTTPTLSIYLPQHPHTLFTCHNTHATPTLSIYLPQHPHALFTCHNTHTTHTQHTHSPFTCHNTHTLHSGATTPALQFGCHIFSLTKPSPRQTERQTDGQTETETKRTLHTCMTTHHVSSHR